MESSACSIRLEAESSESPDDGQTSHGRRVLIISAVCCFVVLLLGGLAGGAWYYNRNVESMNSKAGRASANLSSVGGFQSVSAGLNHDDASGKSTGQAGAEWHVEHGGSMVEAQVEDDSSSSKAQQQQTAGQMAIDPDHADNQKHQPTTAPLISTSSIVVLSVGGIILWSLVTIVCMDALGIRPKITVQGIFQFLYYMIFISPYAFWILVFLSIFNCCKKDCGNESLIIILTLLLLCGSACFMLIFLYAFGQSSDR